MGFDLGDKTEQISDARKKNIKNAYAGAIDLKLEYHVHEWQGPIIMNFWPNQSIPAFMVKEKRKICQTFAQFCPPLFVICR